MICPQCGGVATIQHSQKASENAVKRTRICLQGHRTVTYERTRENAPSVPEMEVVELYRALPTNKHRAFYKYLLKQSEKLGVGIC